MEQYTKGQVVINLASPKWWKWRELVIVELPDLLGDIWAKPNKDEDNKIKPFLFKRAHVMEFFRSCR